MVNDLEEILQLSVDSLLAMIFPDRVICVWGAGVLFGVADDAILNERMFMLELM